MAASCRRVGPGKTIPLDQCRRKAEDAAAGGADKGSGSSRHRPREPARKRSCCRPAGARPPAEKPRSFRASGVFRLAEDRLIALGRQGEAAVAAMECRRLLRGDRGGRRSTATIRNVAAATSAIVRVLRPGFRAALRSAEPGQVSAAGSSRPAPSCLPSDESPRRPTMPPGRWPPRQRMRRPESPRRAEPRAAPEQDLRRRRSRSTPVNAPASAGGCDHDGQDSRPLRGRPRAGGETGVLYAAPQAKSRPAPTASPLRPPIARLAAVT